MRSFIQSKWKILSISFLCGLCVFYFGTNIIIDYQVDSIVTSASANNENTDDAIASLIALVHNEQAPFSARNKAIWALGRKGDPKALEVLESFQTGTECNHDHELCQHKLTKAIKLCQSK